jgi:YD repeat-containing protein
MELNSLAFGHLGLHELQHSWFRGWPMSDQAGGASAEASQYGAIYSYEAGYAPNGNILTHTDSVMGTWNFTYDAVDRLSTAQNTVAGNPSTYANQYGCWSYDAYGNRLSESMSSTPCDNNPGFVSWAHYNTANNRMTSSSYALGGVIYDASGNTLDDGLNQYWYDAEGQLCAAQKLSGGYPIQYVYDGGWRMSDEQEMWVPHVSLLRHGRARASTRSH